MLLGHAVPSNTWGSTANLSRYWLITAITVGDSQIANSEHAFFVCQKVVTVLALICAARATAVRLSVAFEVQSLFKPQRLKIDLKPVLVTVPTKYVPP